MDAVLSVPIDGEPLTELEIAEARKSSAALNELALDAGHVRIIGTRSGGEELCAELPTRAVKILATLMNEMAEGRPVTLIPKHAELTTHQAADLLLVSRPYLIKL